MIDESRLWLVQVLALVVAALVASRLVPTPTPAISITELVYLGPNESVTLTNQGDRKVDLGSWRLESFSYPEKTIPVEDFRFPSPCVLPPGKSVRIHSGPDAAVSYRQKAECTFAADQEVIDLYCLECWVGTKGEGYVWHDEGDRARLLDRYGRVVHEYSYPETKP